MRLEITTRSYIGGVKRLAKFFCSHPKAGTGVNQVGSESCEFPPEESIKSMFQR